MGLWREGILHANKYTKNKDVKPEAKQLEQDKLRDYLK